MKVVAFIANLSKGGAQGVFINTVNYLFEHGIEVEVVVQSLYDSIYKDKLNKKIKIIDLNVSSAKKMLPRLNQYLKYHLFSHALVFGAEIAVNLHLLKKYFKYKFKIIGRSLNTLTQEFSYADGFFRKEITARLVRCFFHKIDFAIAQSTNMKNDMIENWGFDAEKVIVINNALQPAYENEAISIKKNDKENYIMYAGRLEKQKGIEMLLQAFSMLDNKTVSLKIIGSGSLRDNLMRQCNELGIEDRVTFIEHTTDIMKYYKKARIVVLTSYFEGFPNVLLESIACGTPVISYDLPSGPKEIIVDGVNGLLVPYLDVEGFAKASSIALRENWDDNEVKKTSFRYFRENIMPKYIKVIEEV